MKKATLGISVVGNVVLVGALLWMRASYQEAIFTLVDLSMQGDEHHLMLHAKSLSALESDDPDEVSQAIEVLRLITANGEKTEGLRGEFRRAVGLGG